VEEMLTEVPPVVQDGFNHQNAKVLDASFSERCALGASGLNARKPKWGEHLIAGTPLSGV